MSKKTFKTKAELSFDRKLGHLLRDGRKKPDPGPVMAANEAAAERFRRELETPLPLDTGAVADLFSKFGAYLELIDDASGNAGQAEPAEPTVDA